ncbi:DNA glycosylase, partial [Dacryopinax primogenitus]
MSPPNGFTSLQIPISLLNLHTVLTSGQSFLWHIYPLSPPHPQSHEYRLCITDRLICLRQDNTHIYYRTVFPTSSSSPTETTESWLNSYFQLSVNLPSLYTSFSLDPHFARLALRPQLQGIRILRQDPWECLLSFLCSQNNHIARITNMVHSLPEHFSLILVHEPHPSQDRTVQYRPFPAPEVLAKEGVESQLRALGFGYRAKYVSHTASALCSASPPGRAKLLELRTLPLPQAREFLLSLPGVGPKVADCTLLMSLDQPGVVPVDTHVLRVAKRYYGLKLGKGMGGGKGYERVAQGLRDVWGEWAGWAQGV